VVFVRLFYGVLIEHAYANCVKARASFDRVICSVCSHGERRKTTLALVLALFQQEGLGRGRGLQRWLVQKAKEAVQPSEDKDQAEHGPLNVGYNSHRGSLIRLAMLL
jgi:hypothetical protein